MTTRRQLLKVKVGKTFMIDPRPDLTFTQGLSEAKVEKIKV